MRSTDVTLTIGAIAEATGVSVDMLRSWERRYGFPVPERHAGGHRRYHADHVTQIEQVQADRRAGMSLEAAIDRTRHHARRDETSIFAGLRRRWPEQPVGVVSKRVLLAATWAIEDESCAQADRPVLIGCFQRERFYRQSEQRWRELARTASSALVFADFATARQRRGRATEIAVAADDPLLREWVIICESPHVAACIAAVEPAGQGIRQDRRFEAMWSVDPRIVRDALEIATALAGPIHGAGTVPTLAMPVGHPDASLRTASALLQRTIAFLDT